MDLPFQVLDGGNPADRKTWVALWELWQGREVFAHPAYVSLFAGPDVRVCCAAFSAGRGSIMYPFLLRAIGRETYCPESLKGAYDITTPYGYGGPFCWGPGDWEVLTAKFWLGFSTWCREHSVVSEFIRFALAPTQLLAYPGKRIRVLDNIICDLEQGPEREWMGFEHKVRKNVKRARGSGVVIEVDENGHDLESFRELYLGTMDRRHAASAYYFSLEFFEQLNSSLTGQFVYFHAKLGGKIVSTELVLLSAENMYSYLGGTDAAAYEARPNDLLKFEALQWGRRHKKKRFILGGGYQAGDGIFRYKKAFSPNGIVPFYVGHRVIEPRLYDQLVSARWAWAVQTGTEWSPRPDYFPAYRT